VVAQRCSGAQRSEQAATQPNSSVRRPGRSSEGEVSVRQIRYVVTASLDGFIAGPNGEVDWIVPDPDRDFRALLDQFDTALLGRRSYELTQRPGAPPWPPGMSVYVFSRTLRRREHPEVTIVADKLEETLAALRVKSGKDIWLFGGGSLFRSVLEAGLVDTVEVAVRPVLLGGGIPLLPPPAKQANLKLIAHEVSKAGIVALRYAVQ
jgi:dihydrofolate reductase